MNINVNPNNKNYNQSKNDETNKKLIKKKVTILSNIKDVESIMNSKFAPLYFMLFDDFLKDKLREKIHRKLRTNKQNSKLWDIIYQNSLIRHKGLLPKLVFKYIFKKATEKYNEIAKEAQKRDRKVEDFAMHFAKQCQKLRKKIVEIKRIEGVELEATNYFKAPLRRRTTFKFINNLSKRFKYVISKKNDANKLNIISIFNLNKNFEEVKDIDSSSDEEAKEEFVKNQFEKVKENIQIEKTKIENEKKKNKKFNHIKSRLFSITPKAIAVNKSKFSFENRESEIFKLSPRQNSPFSKFKKSHPSSSCNYYVNMTTNDNTCSSLNSKNGKDNQITTNNIKIKRKSLFNIQNINQDNFNSNPNKIIINNSPKPTIQATKTFLPPISGFFTPFKFQMNKLFNTCKNKNTTCEFFEKSDFYYK